MFSIRINVSQVIWRLLKRNYVLCILWSLFREQIQASFLEITKDEQWKLSSSHIIFGNYLNVLITPRTQLRIPTQIQNFVIVIHSIAFNFNFKLFLSLIHNMLSIIFFSIYQKTSDALWVCFHARKAKTTDKFRQEYAIENCIGMDLGSLIQIYYQSYNYNSCSTHTHI